MSYKLDLHVHAAERSACATSKEEHQIRAAIAAGLDGLAFTDHHKLVTESRIVELNERFSPFRIYSGIEVTAEHEDWLVYGLRDPHLQREDWTYADLAAQVRRSGGFIALAHPFRYSRTLRVDLAASPPDGIEVRSTNTSLEREAEIRALAGRHGLTLLNNSDAHHTSRVGKFWNDLAELPGDDAGLVQALLSLGK